MAAMLAAAERSTVSPAAEDSASGAEEGSSDQQRSMEESHSDAAEQMEAVLQDASEVSLEADVDALLARSVSRLFSHGESWAAELCCIFEGLHIGVAGTQQTFCRLPGVQPAQ